jgi:acetyl esterase/lipase
MSQSLRIWIALATLGVPAAQAIKPPEPDSDSTEMKPIVYQVPGMDAVHVSRNLKYTDVNNPYLLMDVYTPLHLKKEDRRPAVLFIHGGAGAEEAPKNWGVYTSWGRVIAASGMVGVTFSHRLGYPNPLLAEAASDVTAAIKYVRANAEMLNVDRDRICLAAFSAGGPLLSLAMRDQTPYVRCLVAFYAFLDIRQSELHKKYENPVLLRSFSPIIYLEKNAGRIVPMFIARAGQDRIPTMNDSIDRFIREGISRNAAVTVVNHPRGVHGFDIQNNDERSREIIEEAIDFMQHHLGESGHLQ